MKMTWEDWLPWAIGAGGVAVIAYGLVTDTKIVLGNSGPLVVKGVGNGQYMSSDAADAFNAMAAAAALDGVTLLAGSGFRSLIEQAELYAKYQAGINFVNGSNARAAAPGTSNHGSGIAIDVADGNGKTITSSSPQFAWLTSNASGFMFDWAEGRSINEPWHWDFVG